MNLRGVHMRAVPSHCGALVVTALVLLLILRTGFAACHQPPKKDPPGEETG
jgi:hypothetical protein